VSPRLKKLIAVAVLVPALIVYLFAAAALSEVLPSFWLVKLIYFIIAGVAWAFPIKYLILWANAEPGNPRK